MLKKTKFYYKINSNQLTFKKKIYSNNNIFTNFLAFNTIEKDFLIFSKLQQNIKFLYLFNFPKSLITILSFVFQITYLKKKISFLILRHKFFFYMYYTFLFQKLELKKKNLKFSFLSFFFNLQQQTKTSKNLLDLKILTFKKLLNLKNLYQKSTYNFLFLKSKKTLTTQIKQLLPLTHLKRFKKKSIKTIQFKKFLHLYKQYKYLKRQKKMKKNKIIWLLKTNTNNFFKIQQTKKTFINKPFFFMSSQNWLNGRISNFKNLFKMLQSTEKQMFYYPFFLINFKPLQQLSFYIQSEFQYIPQYTLFNSNSNLTQQDIFKIIYLCLNLWNIKPINFISLLNMLQTHKDLITLKLLISKYENQTKKRSH